MMTVCMARRQKMAVRISGAVDRMDEITLVGEALQVGGAALSSSS
jgi:hypothetical protein